MANAQVKKGCWVLTSEYNDHDQHGEYFEAIFAEQPTLEQLAGYFKGSSGMPRDVMEAVAFLEKLRKGGGRIETEYCWYNLQFKEFS